MRLDNSNSALTEQIWQQFQRDNPGATWADFRMQFPPNVEVTQQSGPMGTVWVPVTPPPTSTPAPNVVPGTDGFDALAYVQQSRADDGRYQNQYADYLQAQNEATAYRDQLGSGLHDAADADVWQAARLNTPIVIRNGQAVDVKNYLQQKYGTFDWTTFLKNNNIADLPDNPQQQASVYKNYLNTLKGYTQSPGLFAGTQSPTSPTPPVAPVAQSPAASSFQPAASGSGLLGGSPGSSGNAANSAYGMLYDQNRARSFTTGPAPTVQDSSAWAAQYPSMFL